MKAPVTGDGAIEEELYPRPTREPAGRRRLLAPRPVAAFRALSESVFAEGALTTKTKQLIAVAHSVLALDVIAGDASTIHQRR